MRVLLTGGAGFIGSHIALLLLERGYDVLIFDSFTNSSSNVIERIKNFLDNKALKYKLRVINGDIRDKKILESIFSKCVKENKPIEVVIHLAGVKSVAESLTNPLYYWDVNVFGTLNLLLTMKEYECYSFVFSSSATIYGLSDSVPMAEDHRISPINPYGKTKVAIENMFYDLYNSNNLWKICSLRYFNPVGAHPSGLIGEDPIGIPNNLFPFITQVAIGRQKIDTIISSNANNRVITGTGKRPLKSLAEMLKGGVIMDVTNPEQANIAEDAGACAVMALERIPADIRKDGGISRMSDPEMIKGIQDTVSIPAVSYTHLTLPTKA